MELPRSKIDIKLNYQSDSLDSIIKEHIMRTYAALKKNKLATARVLKISRPRLQRALDKYKLE